MLPQVTISDFDVLDCGYETPCHVWQRARTTAGYGEIWIDGKACYAHVVAYEAENGPVPDGLELDHLCRNPPCINPAHLEAVTHAENMRRAGFAKLTDDQAREIKRLLGTMSQAKIAALFGINQSSVSDIHRSVTYRNV